MNRLILLFLAVMLILSCGKKEVKKETEEGRIASEAVTVTERLKTSYLKRDRGEIERLTTPQGAKDILPYLNSFDSAELSFTPAWIEIDKGKISLNISWKGSWLTAGKRVEDRGMAIFELKGQPLRIDKVLRANPFLAH